MKKLTFIAALIFGASFTASAAELPKAKALDAVQNVAEVSEPASAVLASVVLKDYYEYRYSMCGHTGIAAANSQDDLVDLLNMLNEQYCG